VGSILDTNTLSAIAEEAPGAAKKFARARQVAIPFIVRGECHFGIAQSRPQRRTASPKPPPPIEDAFLTSLGKIQAQDSVYKSCRFSNSRKRLEGPFKRSDE
jgi:hypothetical protein